MAAEPKEKLNGAHKPVVPDWRNALTDYPFPSHFTRVGGELVGGELGPGASGFQMHYLDQGQGRPILMVHGNPTWSYYYRRLVSELSGDNRCIAVDHIGCGLSEKPNHLAYDLETRISHLVELVRILDLRDICLLVHDWGGAIGLGAALQDLDRYERFVIFNTAAFPPPFFPWRIRVCRTPVIGKIALQGFNLFARAAITMATEQKGGLEKKIAAGMLAPYNNWANRRAIYEFVTDIPTDSNQATWQRLHEVESGLSRLSSHPVSLIWGMKDWCFRPECLRKFQTILPNAETTEFDDAGHYVVEDKPNEIVQLVKQFLVG